MVVRYRRLAVTYAPGSTEVQGPAEPTRCMYFPAAHAVQPFSSTLPRKVGDAVGDRVVFKLQIAAAIACE